MSRDVEVATALEPLEQHWDALAGASGNVFATFEWNALWWRHFGADRELRVLVCARPGSGAAAIVPLYVWRRRPVRILRLLGHGPGDELGPVCAPAERSLAADAVRGAPARLGADVLLAECLHGDADWPALLGGRVVKREASPALALPPGSWEDFLRTRSANFREQVRRRERRLAREHELHFRLAHDPDRLDDDLSTLFALHRARWGAQRTAFGPDTHAFHRAFARAALARGWLRLWLLELDGVPRAAWYGLRFGNAEAYYQSGRDPAWDRHSVGFVLLVHSIRAALEDGMREYRFLRGGEEYKARFADRDPGLETIALTRGPAGRAAVAGARALRGALRTARTIRKPDDGRSRAQDRPVSSTSVRR